MKKLYNIRDIISISSIRFIRMNSKILTKLYLFCAMNESLILMAFLTFVKFILITNILIEIVAILLTTLSNYSSKNSVDGNKFNKLFNINCVFVILNYLMFHNLNILMDFVEYLQDFVNMYFYLIIIFVLSVCCYITQFFMGLLSCLSIKESWGTINDILSKKDI